VCVKSAIEQIRPHNVLVHCEYEPTGPWWELTRPLVTLNKIVAPCEIFGNPLRHVAHRADVVRLEMLLRDGGIYLDADVFVHRDFDDLLTHRTVLGQQRIDGAIVGLCNAVILAEPEAPFLRRWHTAYRTFRSTGHDEFWDEHSVRLPYQLSQRFPGEVTVLPQSAFYWPTYDTHDLKRIFASVEALDLSEAYANHLWESQVWEQHLEHLIPKQVREIDTNFHRWARPLVNGLPDDYAMPSLGKRLRKKLRDTVNGTRARLSLRTRLRDAGNRARTWLSQPKTLS